jgi:hypothetical protein
MVIGEVTKMNYEAKRLCALECLTKAEDRGKWLEWKILLSTIEKADEAAKVDFRHANGILDRLLKSEFCMYLIEQEGNEKNGNT